MFNSTYLISATINRIPASQLLSRVPLHPGHALVFTTFHDYSNTLTTISRRSRLFYDSHCFLWVTKLCVTTFFFTTGTAFNGSLNVQTHARVSATPSACIYTCLAVRTYLTAFLPHSAFLQVALGSCRLQLRSTQTLSP